MVQKNNGVIDKFLGDGVMAMFGAVVPSQTYARDAMRAIESAIQSMDDWNAQRVKGGELSLTVNASAASERNPGAIRIVSVGRVVEKKGYDDLLSALAQLPDTLDWGFEHIGGGAPEDTMQARAERLGIAARITWQGRQPQSAVKALLAQAYVFVLASKIATDGDRDGLPNVLMEAQALGVACFSTAVSAIPELITEGETGLLVPPGDPDALAAGLVTLSTDGALRERLAAARPPNPSDPGGRLIRGSRFMLR